MLPAAPPRTIDGGCACDKWFHVASHTHARCKERSSACLNVLTAEGRAVAMCTCSPKESTVTLLAEEEGWLLSAASLANSGPFRPAACFLRFHCRP